MATKPAAAAPGASRSYARRQPETTVLYQILQEHLATFEQQWSQAEEGRALPQFVLEELRGFLACGVLCRGFAVLVCGACKERQLLAFCCKGRAFCPCCLGRRMNEGAANLVDHVLPEGVPLRQWVLTMPFPLRFPLAFDGALLSAVLRLFTDTVDTWYRRRLAALGVPGGRCGAVTVIQRAASDLRLNPHFHTVFLDGVYAASPDGTLVFHPAPAPTLADIEQVAARISRRALRYLEKRGVIAPVTAPGDGEMQVALDENLGEEDPLLAQLLAVATRGASDTRPPVRIAGEDRPTAKGKLGAEAAGFNLQAATRVAAQDNKGREALCRYVLRPPLANDRLERLANGRVRLSFKRPWRDGTSSVVLEPTALIARLAALVPAPRRHVTRYFGVLSSHSKLRSQVVPHRAPAEHEASGEPSGEPPPRGCHYIPWLELLRRTFQQDLQCPRCGGPLRLIALVKEEESIHKILGAMALPTEAPAPHPPRSPP